LCQRYYYQIGGNSVVGTGAYTIIGVGQALNTSTVDMAVPFKVSMMAAPTLVYSGNFIISSGAAVRVVTSVSSLSGTTKNVAFLRTVASSAGLTSASGAVVEANNDSTAFFSFTSEL